MWVYIYMYKYLDGVVVVVVGGGAVWRVRSGSHLAVRRMVDGMTYSLSGPPGNPAVNSLQRWAGGDFVSPNLYSVAL